MAARALRVGVGRVELRYLALHRRSCGYVTQSTRASHHSKSKHERVRLVCARLLEEVGHGMCCIIGLSRPFLALRIKPGHVVTAEHSRIPLSRSGPYEDCLTRKVKRGDRTSKSTLMTLKRAGANRQRGAPFRQEALFFSFFQADKNLTSPILE